MISSSTRRQSLIYCNAWEKFFKYAVNVTYSYRRKKVLYWKVSKMVWENHRQHGLSYDPTNIEAIRDLKHPQAEDKLCQFINCCRWISINILNFYRLTIPLNQILEEVYKKKGGMKKKQAIKRIPLHSTFWGPTCEVALHNIQKPFWNAVKFSYQKQGIVLCIITDGSEIPWASIITKIPAEQCSRTIEHQQHEPMAFLGVHFNSTHRNSTTYEKEVNEIVCIFDRMDHFLWGPHPVHVNTEHWNLHFVFAPLALRTNSPRQLSKVRQRVIHLARFDFQIVHVDGKRNFCADMLTRWAKEYETLKWRIGNIAACIWTSFPVRWKLCTQYGTP